MLRPHSSDQRLLPWPLQVAVHAIGDRAVDEVAAAYIEALEGAGRLVAEEPLALAQRLRPRIEHVQVGGGRAGQAGCLRGGAQGVRRRHTTTIRGVPARCDVVWGTIT
jgi:hypothetical protein